MGNGITLSASPLGDDAVMFYLPEPVQDNYPMILQCLARKLVAMGIVDYVPAYHSLLVIFDPKKYAVTQLISAAKQFVSDWQASADNVGIKSSNIIKVPVCYEGDFAPDLVALAEKAGLTTEAVIAKHCESLYTVCCLGFIPGFAFLGYVDEAIATARRADPRAHVPAGSVGIAGRQTGIYPADSPGGWNIIGRTPMTLYAPERGVYSRFEMGERVQFYPITTKTYETWQDNVGSA